MKKVLFRSGTAEQNPSNKPIHKLCYLWIQLCSINLLHNEGNFVKTWGKYYKVGNFFTKWCKRYYKVGKLWVITKGYESYCKVRQVIFYNVGQSLSQSGAILLQSGAGITKWGKCLHPFHFIRFHFYTSLT